MHTLDQAQILTLTNSQTLTGIGGRLDKGASITGNVTGPVVDDRENLSVSAYQLVDGEWTEVKWGTINSSGTYTLPGLITGSYRVCAAYTDVEWQPACFGAPRVKNAQDVAVVAPNVSSGKNIALVRSGWISGKVVDATGNGLGGISVSAEPVSDDDESDEGGSSTDDSGEYKVFVGAGTYKLSFSDENEDWAPEYYNDKPTAATADALTVVDSAGTTANNTVLAPAASIAGTVTTATANNGGHVFSACARNTTTGDEWCDSVDESTGAYNIKGLPAGNTQVRFYGEGPFASEYYSNVREAANASPTPIALTAGQQRTAINATLEIGGTITGKIVYPDGTPAFEGCHIDAWGSTDDAWGEPTLSRSHAHARSDGTFTLEGLSTGSYVLVVGRIRADDGACDPVDDERWYDGDEVLSPQESSAQTFSAVFAQTKSIGTLVYGDPTPLQNTAKPTVPTAPQVGVVATAGDGSWSPAATSFSYVWQADGVTIPGAVSKSYTPGADQAGKKLSVIVTAHRSGSSDGVATSLQSAVVKNGVLTKGTPTISGPPAVGSKLTAGPGVWSPAGVQFAYQWLAQGNIITNATGSTFTPTASEIGQQISVRVTGSRTGYDAANATSAATAAVIDPNAVPTQTAPSAPRIRTAYAGGAGKPIQARATWYAPLSNGGAAIKTYRMVALKYNSSGAIVQRYYATRGATIRSHTFTVPAGRYGFRVQANNDVGASRLVCQVQHRQFALSSRSPNRRSWRLPHRQGRPGGLQRAGLCGDRAMDPQASVHGRRAHDLGPRVLRDVGHRHDACMSVSTANPLLIEDVLSRGGLSPASDSLVTIRCEVCGVMQRASKTPLEPAEDPCEITAYTCRNGCAVLLVTGHPSPIPLPGAQRFRIGDYGIGTNTTAGIEGYPGGQP